METVTNSQTIRTLRTELDFIGNSIKLLTPSREISLAITKNQESKMWLGKVLQELKEPNPYPESKDPSSKKIEAATDRSKDSAVKVWEEQELDHVQRVKDCRKRIEEQIPALFSVYQKLGDDANLDYKIALFAKESYLAAELSMMWLGMELGRIHDSGAISKG